ncbi:MAG: hypothetical protein IJ499_04870 [Clostridia bacterium]|nr:hypothetical protein [Clostridia bacterium]
MAEKKESGFYESELYKIIAGIQSGDQEDFTALKNKYAPLLTGVVHSFDTSDDISEYEKEAESALLRAALKFDTEQGEVAFGLFAKICIRNALVSLRRKEMSKKRRMERAAKKEEKRSRNFYSPELISSAETEMLVDRIRQVLSPYERKVFDEYMSDKTVEEIAAEVKRPGKSVSNALYRIKEKVKALDIPRK